MAEMIFLVDMAKCIACEKCELACAQHNLHEMNATRARITILKRPAPRAGEDAGIPVVCLQCDDAACVRVCQFGALTRHAMTGAIEVHRDRCVRCKMCVAACPFGNMTWDAPTQSVQKCDLCRGTPQCVLYCPTGALKYRPAGELAMPRMGEETRAR
jgi:carbon-monoxide dehydrogenase iron sulfur subunit